MLSLHAKRAKRNYCDVYAALFANKHKAIRESCWFLGVSPCEVIHGSRLKVVPYNIEVTVMCSVTKQ